MSFETTKIVRQLVLAAGLTSLSAAAGADHL